MAFDFPNAPTVGQVYGGYSWDGEKWIGATSSGAIYVNDPPPPNAPVNSLWWNSTTGVLSIKYSDGNSTQWVALLGGSGSAGAVLYDTAQSLTANQKARARANIDALKKNYVLNGAMMVSQENGAAASAANGYYPVDQWFINAVALTTATFSVAQVAAVTPAGSPNRIRCTVSAAQATPGSSTIAFTQKIEGNRVADALWGTTAAKDLVAQVGVKTPVAGTYLVYIYNSAVDTGVTGTFTVGAGEVNTDVVKSAVLVARTTGVWQRDNGIGMWFNIYLMHQSQTANVFATNTNVFELFDVSLTEGNAAPPFVVPDYASELAACMRYFQVFGGNTVGMADGYYTIGIAGVVSPTAAYVYLQFETPMRAAPTMSHNTASAIFLGASSNYTSSAINYSHQSFYSVTLTVTITGGSVSPALGLVQSPNWIKANARL